MRSSSAILVYVGVITMMMFCSMISGMPPLQCTPNVLMNADPEYRQMCVVLNEIQDVIEEPVQRVPDLFEPIDSGVKRKNVDHVFLRFGRPRM